MIFTLPPHVFSLSIAVSRYGTCSGEDTRHNTVPKEAVARGWGGMSDGLLPGVLPHSACVPTAGRRRPSISSRNALARRLGED